MPAGVSQSLVGFCMRLGQHGCWRHAAVSKAVCQSKTTLEHTSQLPVQTLECKMPSCGSLGICKPLQNFLRGLKEWWNCRDFDLHTDMP